MLHTVSGLILATPLDGVNYRSNMARMHAGVVLRLIGIPQAPLQIHVLGREPQHHFTAGRGVDQRGHHGVEHRLVSEYL